MINFNRLKLTSIRSEIKPIQSFGSSWLGGLLGGLLGSLLGWFLGGGLLDSLGGGLLGSFLGGSGSLGCNFS